MKSLPELRIALGNILDQITKLQEKFSWKDDKSFYYERQLSSLYEQADAIASSIIVAEKKRGKALYEERTTSRPRLSRKILQKRMAAKTLGDMLAKI
jgi:hypothetical protein